METQQTRTVNGQQVVLTAYCARYNMWAKDYSTCNARKNKIIEGTRGGDPGCIQCAGVAKEYRRCKECGLIIPLKEFPKNSQGKISIICRECKHKPAANLFYNRLVTTKGNKTGRIRAMKDMPDGSRKYQIRFDGGYTQWVNSNKVVFNESSVETVDRGKRRQGRMD